MTIQIASCGGCIELRMFLYFTDCARVLFIVSVTRLVQKRACENDTFFFLDCRFCFVFNCCVVCRHGWQWKLLFKGAKEPLEAGDIYNLPKMDHLDKLSEEYDKLVKESPQMKIQIMKILLMQSRSTLIVAFVNLLLSTIFGLSLPYFIKEISLFYENEDNEYDSLSYRIIISCGLALTRLFKVLFITHGWTELNRLKVRIEILLMFIIYRKSISMSLSSRNKSNSGQTVNLMSKDSSKVSGFYIALVAVINDVCGLFAALIYLFIEVGIAIIPGFIFCLLTLPIQSKIGEKIGTIKRNMIAVSDTRVKFINEILQGIRIVKLYAWEIPLLNKVSNLRKR